MNCFGRDFLMPDSPLTRCPYSPTLTTKNEELDIQITGHMYLAKGLCAELGKRAMTFRQKRRVEARISDINVQVENLLALAGVSFDSLDANAFDKPTCTGEPIIDNPTGLAEDYVCTITCARDAQARQAE